MVEVNNTGNTVAYMKSTPFTVVINFVI